MQTKDLCPIEPTIREDILARLARVEREDGVRMLMAVESGVSPHQTAIMTCAFSTSVHVVPISGLSRCAMSSSGRL